MDFDEFNNISKQHVSLKRKYDAFVQAINTQSTPVHVYKCIYFKDDDDYNQCIYFYSQNQLKEYMVSNPVFQDFIRKRFLIYHIGNYRLVIYNEDKCKFFEQNSTKEIEINEPIQELLHQPIEMETYSFNEFINALKNGSVQAFDGLQNNLFFHIKT